MKVASMSELKNKTSRFLKQAQKEDVIVTSRGKPVARITRLSDDALEDYALLKDPELKLRLEPGIKATDKGKLVTVEERIALKRFYEESNLFEHLSEAEKQRYQPASEDVLEMLARKAAKGNKPLSQILIEERGGY